MSTLTKKTIQLSYHKDYKVNIERYDSALEVVHNCRIRTKTDRHFKDETQRERSKSWDGVDSYDEALTLLRDGYQPTVDKLQASIKANVKGETGRIAFNNQIYGFAPIVPLALKGVPNCMMNMTMKPIKCKVIDVYYDMTVTAGVSSERIIENGQKLLSAIIALEKQGYRFNLYACQAYSRTSTDMLIIKIKSSDKPIDLKRISFPLTHPAFFRVIGFDWYSKVPGGTYRDGYGTSLENVLSDNEINELTTQVLGKNAIFIQADKIMRKDEDHIREVLTNDKSEN